MKFSQARIIIDCATWGVFYSHVISDNDVITPISPVINGEE